MLLKPPGAPLLVRFWYAVLIGTFDLQNFRKNFIYEFWSIFAVEFISGLQIALSQIPTELLRVTVPFRILLPLALVDPPANVEF